MKNKKPASKLISDFAKDIIANNIHGYGKKNYVQDYVDQKIKEFNELRAVCNDEESIEYTVKKVFEEHKAAFEKLDDMFHPLHYGGDKTYEVIKVLEAWDIDFHLGNAIKYIYRSGKKNVENEIKDLENAKWYIQRKIDLLKKN
jgi:hypothetical protein